MYTDFSISGPSAHIRSFVLRQGRLTSAQQRALNTLWSTWGIDLGSDPLDLATVFGRMAPRVLEIGFGDGEALVAMAQQDPQTDYLGIEVHRPGIGHALLCAEALTLRNLRLIEADASAVLTTYLPSASLNRVNVFFPDPWPKARHHKRRLIRPAFLEAVRRCLIVGGMLHVATDVEDYAKDIMVQLANAPGWQSKMIPRPMDRPLTKFERRGLRLDHGVWDICGIVGPKF